MRKMMPVTPKRIQRRAPIPSLRVSRITPAVIAAFAFLKMEIRLLRDHGDSHEEHRGA